MGFYNFVFFKNKNITKYVIIHEYFLIGKNLPKNKKVEVLLRLTKTISKKMYDFDMQNPKSKNELTFPQMWIIAKEKEAKRKYLY